jgi:DNA mismatch endonuclease (patch repair protein)
MKEKLCIRSRAPAASSKAVRRVMLANHSRDTKAECRLRTALHASGLRFRKDYSPDTKLPKIDIVFPRHKVCVFIDGCFWHGCGIHFSLPKTHASWWKEKIEATIERDHRQTLLLQSRNWKVIRIWEHEITPDSLKPLVLRIQSHLSSLPSSLDAVHKCSLI